MKMPNIKTLLITVGAGAFILGFIMKSGREDIAKDPKAEPLAKKFGLI